MKGRQTDRLETARVMIGWKFRERVRPRVQKGCTPKAKKHIRMGEFWHKISPLSNMTKGKFWGAFVRLSFNFKDKLTPRGQYCRCMSRVNITNNNFPLGWTFLKKDYWFTIKQISLKFRISTKKKWLLQHDTYEIIVYNHRICTKTINTLAYLLFNNKTLKSSIWPKPIKPSMTLTYPHNT